MTNARIWLVMALAFGVLFAGCSNGTTDNGGEDTWSSITDINQVYGLWKIDYSRTMAIQEWYGTYNGLDDPNGLPNGSAYNPSQSLLQLSSIIGSQITSIEITSKPAKMEYTIGESFDPAGLVITIHYFDSEHNAGVISLTDTAPNLDCTCNFDSAGTKSIIVTYYNIPIAIINNIIVDRYTSDFYGNINVTYQSESFWTFSMIYTTALVTGTNTVFFSGGNIDDPSVWDAIKEDYINEPDYTIDDVNKSISVTYSIPESLYDQDSNYDVLSLMKISQDRTKLLIPAGVMENFNDLIMEDAIAIKQL